MMLLTDATTAPAPVGVEPLTDEQIESCIDEANRGFNRYRSNGPRGQQLTPADDWKHWLARAIERAHGIGAAAIPALPEGHEPMPDEREMMRAKATDLIERFQLKMRLRDAAEQQPQLKRYLWGLLHEAATEIERLQAASLARAADADRLARFEEWLSDRAGPLLHIDSVREALG